MTRVFRQAPALLDEINFCLYGSLIGRVILLFDSVAMVQLPSVSTAVIPRLINHPGMLTDNSGNPFSGSRQLTFQIYDDTLDKVTRLRSVYFDWNEIHQQDIGMIAEEMAEVIPEVVA